MMPSVSHTLVSPKADTEFIDSTDAVSSEREFSALLDSRGKAGAGLADQAESRRTRSSSAESKSTSRPEPAEPNDEQSELESAATSSSERSQGASSRSSSPAEEANASHATPLHLSTTRALGLLPATGGTATGLKSKAAMSIGGGIERMGRSASSTSASGQLPGSTTVTAKRGLSGEMATESLIGAATASARLAGEATSATGASAMNTLLTSSALSSTATSAFGAATSALPTSSISQAAVPTLSIPQPVGSPDWSQQLGDRILTVMRADLGEAVINLAPEELGPVKVSLTLTDGEVRLHWMAPVNETRQALEQALPRLREMFAQEGLQLADSQVSAGGDQNKSGNFMQSPLARATMPEASLDGESGAPEKITVISERNRTGLLDLYV